MKARNVPNLTRQHYSISLSASCKQQMAPKAVPVKEAILCPVFLPPALGFFSYKINWIQSLRPDVPLPYWKLQEGLFYKNTSMRGCHGNLTWLGEQIVVLVPGQAALRRMTLYAWLGCAFPDPQPWDSPCKPISWCFHVGHQLYLWLQLQIQWTLTQLHHLTLSAEHCQNI